MGTGDHLKSGYGPLGLASPDGIPWVRLVTGVFAVLISFATYWHVGPSQVDEGPRPIPERMVMGVPLDPLQTEVQHVSALGETASVPASLAHVPRTAATTPPRPPQRHRLQRTATHAKVQPARLAHAGRKAGANPWSAQYQQIAYTTLTRKRSEVRSEYIAAREQVAAFTSEDSGSAYLTRLAARQRAMRPLPSQADQKSRVNRRAR